MTALTRETENDEPPRLIQLAKPGRLSVWVHFLLLLQILCHPTYVQLQGMLSIFAPGAGPDPLPNLCGVLKIVLTVMPNTADVRQQSFEKSGTDLCGQSAYY